MTVKRRPRGASPLTVRRIHGYVAVNTKPQHPHETLAWLYLRKHSSTQLFVGNIPEPRWLPDRGADRTVPQHVQARVQAKIRLLLPDAEQVGDVFSTGNGRLATRVAVKGAEPAIDRILQRPGHHLYMEYWRELHEDDAEDGLLARWLEEYDAERDEAKVLAWSNAAMKAYEVRERRRAEEKERRKREGAMPDEGGFVLVTEGAKQMKAADAEKVGVSGRIGKGRYKSKSAKNRKSLLDANKGIEKDGFYRWQRKNENVLVDLQKKFKEDTKKIAAIRGLERPEGNGV